MNDQFKYKDDFGPLADKGWSQLSQKLDEAMPVPPKTPSYLPKIIAFTALLGLIAVVLTWTNRPVREPVSIIEPIVSHFSLEVPAPVIVIERPVVVNQIIISQTKTTETLTSTASSKFIGLSLSQNKKSFFSIQDRAGLVARSLPFVENTVELLKNEVILKPSLIPIGVTPVLKDKQNMRLGLTMSASANGSVEGTGVGGGISVLVPLNKQISIEPGVGYGRMRYNNHVVKDESMLYARMAPSPYTNLRYRLRESIEMPLSIHYKPIEQIALTGGVDLDVLLSQKMVFNNNESAFGTSAYAKRLNAQELEQLNRVNLGAHGGVSWFPTASWKLGLYYGQNFTQKTKTKSSKLRFSNQTYRVRLAHYF